MTKSPDQDDKKKPDDEPKKPQANPPWKDDFSTSEEQRKAINSDKENAENMRKIIEGQDLKVKRPRS